MDSTLRRSIKVAIANSGKSQNEIAKLSGMGSSNLSEFLTGKRGAGLRNLEAVAGELGFEVGLVGAQKPKKRRD